MRPAGGEIRSFDLKEMAHAALLTQQRDGRNLIYRANFARMNDLHLFKAL